jgi:hypothetical protein
MGKKNKKLLQRLDAEEAAETQARKDKEAAEAVPVVTNEPTETVQSVETTSLPGFENSKMVSTRQRKPGESLSEALKGTPGFDTQKDFVEKKEETNKLLSSPHLAKQLEGGAGFKLNDSVISNSIADYETTIADKENAELQLAIDNKKLINEAAQGGDSQLVNALNSQSIQESADASAVGEEILNDQTKTNIAPRIEEAIRSSEKTGNPIDISVKDIQALQDDIDYSAMYGMDPETQGKINVLNRLMNNPKLRVRKGEPAIERMGLGDYYPDINQPLQVGSYSGSIVGNIPIFTAKGDVLPIGVYDARRRAVQAEATNKKKKAQQFLELANIKAAPQYKQDLDNQTFSLLDEYIKTTNGDVDKLMDLRNPEAKQFWQKYNTLKNVGDQTMWIQKRSDKLLEYMQDPKAYIPEHVQGLMKDWYEGGFDVNEISNDPKKLKELNKVYNGMKDYDNMTYYVSQNISHLEKDKLPMDVTSSIQGLPAEQYDDLIKKLNMGDNDAFITSYMKYVPDDRLSGFINGMYKQHDFGLPKEEFAQYVWSHIGKEVVPNIDLRSNKNLEWSKFKYQKEKDQQDRIWENFKINSNNVDNKNKLFEAAQNGEESLMTAMKNTNGLGDVKKNANGVLVQTIDTRPLQGKKGTQTFNDADKILIGGQWKTPSDIKNQYSKFGKYVIDEVDKDGNSTGKKVFDTWNMALDGAKVPESPEERALIMYGAQTGWSDNMQFATKFEKANAYQAYKDKDGKNIPMKSEDYKDPSKVGNARPMASTYQSIGFFSNGKFIPMGKSVKFIDATNDADRAGLDSYYSSENTQYNTSGNISAGGTTTDEDVISSEEPSTVIDFGGLE